MLVVGGIWSAGADIGVSEFKLDVKIGGEESTELQVSNCVVQWF